MRVKSEKLNKIMLFKQNKKFTISKKTMKKKLKIKLKLRKEQWNNYKKTINSK